jgi:DoxX-like family
MRIVDAFRSQRVVAVATGRGGARAAPACAGMGGIRMFTAYVVVTVLAALACAYAVYANFTHARFVTEAADRLGIPVSLSVPFGILLGSAGVGLLAGFAVPGLGTAAASGLLAYFVIALAAHLRAHDFQLAWPLIYLLLAAAALVTGLAYHGPLG